MNGQNNDFDIFGLNDPMKRKAASAQMTSARDVAEYYEYQEKQKAALVASNKSRSDAQREKDRIEAVRYETSERAQKERDRAELIRYQKNRRLSLIAIWIAVVSAVLAAIALFK